MVQYVARDHILHLIAFQSVLLLIVLSNAWVLRWAARHSAPRRYPRVSVLVPARDEERSIARCIGSLLDQDYPNFQILVLDDQSTDGTAAILEQMARPGSGLQVLHGEPLPPGWLGKHWACSQLAARADGALLFFTDADTVHRPQALRAAVSILEGERADLLTGFPRQRMCTWGERFIVPLFGWAFYCFTPLLVAYQVKLPALSAAIGQMMLFRREAYQAVGGHAVVRANVAEDMSLARQVKACGYRWRVMDATRFISCRMYHSGREAYAGLCKNLFAAFGFRLLPYLFVWLWLAVVFLEPPLLLGLHSLGVVAQAPSRLLLVSVGLSFALWLISCERLGFPLYLAALYPVTLLTTEFVALGSLWLTVTGRLAWKGRALVRPRLRWF